MRLNTPNTKQSLKTSRKTHEGAPAKKISDKETLRRTVMSCLLWENQFYESGEDIAKRISDLCAKVSENDLAEIAIEARERMYLRHAPLLIVREMARLRCSNTAETIARVIQRADELTEFLAIYWKDGRQPLSAQVRKGLAKAFRKFDEYQLAKYNRRGAIKLRDVLFLAHPKPKDDAQKEVWNRLASGNLSTPDTWETNLSAGADKKETFERLLSEKKLGGLALLRNLRNMEQAGVKRSLIKSSLKEMSTDKILPFRFVAAARHAKTFEPELESALFRCTEAMPKMAGETVVLVDVSGSMFSRISSKSDMDRADAAVALAMVAREICESVRVFSFSNNLMEVAPRRGFALSDEILRSQPNGGTYLGAAMKYINDNVECDRVIVITDEQSHDPVSNPKCGKGYMINVASYKNGVGYKAWTHIDGWSESVIRFIQEVESL